MTPRIRFPAMLSAAVAILLITAGLGRAAPLEPSRVPANAKWLVHVDVDGMRASKVIQKIYNECVDGSGLKECFDAMAKRSAMDPRKDLHSLTLYGTKIAPRHGVMMIHAAMDENRLKQAADKAPDHAEAKYRNYTLHTWTHEKHGQEMTAAGALVKPDLLVLASSTELLKQAIDRIDGRGKALADDSPLAADVPAGALFVVRAIEIDKAEVADKYPLCAQLASFRYAEGEHEGQWFGHVAITAHDTKAGEKLQAALEGFRAMAWLHLQKAPQLQQLLDGVETSRSGNTVKVDFEAPADEVAQAMTPVCQWIKKHGFARMARMYRDRADQAHHGKDHGAACAAEGDTAGAAEEHRHHHEMKEGDRRHHAPKAEDGKARPRKSGEKQRDRKKAARADEAEEESTGMRNPTARQGSAVLGVIIGKPVDREVAAVIGVRRESAAAKAGLQPGDIVVRFDNVDITSPEKLRVAVLRHKPGDRVTLVVERQGEKKEIEVELGGGDDFGG